MYPEKLLILFNFGIKVLGIFLGRVGGDYKRNFSPSSKTKQKNTFKEIKYLLYFLQMFPYNSHNLFVKRDEEMD